MKSVQGRSGWAISSQPAGRWPVPTVLLTLKFLTHFWHNESRLLDVIAHLTMSGYMIFLWTLVLRRVLSHPQITRDTVVGAVCGYLLIAFIFGSLYAALMTIDPGAFSGAGIESVSGKLDQIGPKSWTMIYFSFTTLTTLGFGDVLPVLPMARSLTVMEVLAGQLYLGAFVARLVGGLTAPSSNP